MTMKTIEALPGDNISEVAAKAVQMVIDGEPSVSFDFNGIMLTATPGKSPGDICAEYDTRLEEQHKAYMAPEKVAEREKQAQLAEEKRQHDFRALIDFVKTADEKSLRESAAPWPRSEQELAAYINAVVARSHDYGTCVYAMSLSAVASYNYVAHRLGMTGFQASCADLDILRRNRGLKGGFQIVDFDKLLYPQYLTEEHFPSFTTLLRKNGGDLAKRARDLLAEKGDAHPNVRQHWKDIVEASEQGLSG